MVTDVIQEETQNPSHEVLAPNGSSIIRQWNTFSKKKPSSIVHDSLPWRSRSVLVVYGANAGLAPLERGRGAAPPHQLGTEGQHVHQPARTRPTGLLRSCAGTSAGAAKGWWLPFYDAPPERAGACSRGYSAFFAADCGRSPPSADVGVCGAGGCDHEGGGCKYG